MTYQDVYEEAQKINRVSEVGGRATEVSEAERLNNLSTLIPMNKRSAFDTMK